MHILSVLHAALWGPFTILFMLITGIYLSFVTGFVQFWGVRRLFDGLRHTSTPKGELSPLGALMTSLGTTLGVGSLTGVAAAIYYGGAGAVFWMLLAAFFGMASKYAEILLAVRFRVRRQGSYLGGPMVYLKNVVGSPILAVIFCIFCVMSTFGMGAMAQSNAIAAAVNIIAPIPLWLCGVAVAALVAPIILGGTGWIARVSTVLVPFMTVFYVLGSCALLFVHHDRILPSLELIVNEAFCPHAATGGMLGFLLSAGVRQGFSKGIFSNEAGLGTAPIAHGCATCQSACGEGLLGVAEVFVDTFVVCLLTSLGILVSGTGDRNGLAATMDAFSPVFGGFAPYFIGLCVAFLAISSIVGCSFYGVSCIRFLSDRPAAVKVYQLLLILCVAVGAPMTLDAVLLVSDIANALMAFPNLIALWYLSGFVRNETQLFRRKKYINRL